MKKYLVSVLFVAILALGFSACKRSRSVCGKRRIEAEHKTSKIIPQRVEPRHVIRREAPLPAPRVQKTRRVEPKHEVKTREEDYGFLRDDELSKELEALEMGLGKEF